MLYSRAESGGQQQRACTESSVKEGALRAMTMLYESGRQDVVLCCVGCRRAHRQYVRTEKTSGLVQGSSSHHACHQLRKVQAVLSLHLMLKRQPLQGVARPVGCIARSNSTA